MYGLPDNIDLSFLSGVDLIEIRVGQFQVRLEFEDSAAISVRGTLLIALEGTGCTPEPISCDEGIAQTANTGAVCTTLCKLISLVGRKVIGINRVPDGTLTLRFENEAQVTILDSNHGYESYEISHGERTIIV